MLHTHSLTRNWLGSGITRQSYGRPSRSLGIGFVLGLCAHIGGYMLRSAATMEPLEMLADLLYALGLALWTGVVVAMFVHVFPETKQRQITGALNSYEAALRASPKPDVTSSPGTTERRR